MYGLVLILRIIIIDIQMMVCVYFYTLMKDQFVSRIFIYMTICKSILRIITHLYLYLLDILQFFILFIVPHLGLCLCYLKKYDQASKVLPKPGKEKICPDEIVHTFF